MTLEECLAYIERVHAHGRANKIYVQYARKSFNLLWEDISSKPHRIVSKDWAYHRWYIQRLGIYQEMV